MRIAEVRVHPYRIPFRQPFVTAHGTLAAREGAIIELVTDEGITGLGDMAAVTEFGAVDLPTLLAALDGIRPALLQTEAQPDAKTLFRWVLHGLQRAQIAPPALRFALETAATDALGRVADITEKDRSRTLRVPVNATIGVADRDAASAAAQAAVMAGYGTIKLKVGMSATIADEVRRIKAVRKAIGPATQLRLDANEAWTCDQARHILVACHECDLEYVEQPLPRDDLAGMRALREATGIPIAADEAITDISSVARVCEAEAADVLILKPQLLGGFGAMRNAAYYAQRAQKFAVVTSSLESGVGVAATLRMISRSRFVPPRQKMPACGLATLHLLEDDLIIEDLPIQDGMMQVPAVPGLGVTLDRAALEKYRYVPS